jgi:hypothetical protein
MPRGRPNKDQSSDPRKNKMEAVRQAMSSLGMDAAPLDIVRFVKENFGQDMSPNMASSYKSGIRARAGIKGRRRRGRPRKGDTVSAAASPPRLKDAVPWKDLRTIKDIANRIGKKELRELVSLLD